MLVEAMVELVADRYIYARSPLCDIDHTHAGPDSPDQLIYTSTKAEKKTSLTSTIASRYSS